MEKEEAPIKHGLQVGDKLRVISPIDIFPHCVIDVGAVLVVVEIDTEMHHTEESGLIAAFHASGQKTGLHDTEWDNCVHFNGYTDLRVFDYCERIQGDV